MNGTTNPATDHAERAARRLELRALVQEQLMTRWRATLGWVLIGLGVLAVAVAWYQVRDLPDVALQMPYLISGGLGGALVMALGGALLLSQDFRDDKEVVAALSAKVEELEEVVVRQAEIMGEAVELLAGAARTKGNGARSAARR